MRRSPPQPHGLAQRESPAAAARVLEQIRHARAVQQEAEAELAALIDHAVNLGVGWPQIATQLGVTRQAARQQYQRRHRESASRYDRVA